MQYFSAADLGSKASSVKMEETFYGTINLTKFVPAIGGNVTTLKGAFNKSGIINIQSDLAAANKCTDFSMIFANSQITCIKSINTSSATDTTDMFKNAHVVSPNASQQADIVAKRNQPWVNGSVCN